MEIPGLAVLSGQPTLTNPLNKEQLLQGRLTVATQGSEAHNTEIVRGQASTTVANAEVVSQVSASAATGLDTKHFGGIVDIMA